MICGRCQVRYHPLEARAEQLQCPADGSHFDSQNQHHSMTTCKINKRPAKLSSSKSGMYHVRSAHSMWFTVKETSHSLCIRYQGPIAFRPIAHLCCKQSSQSKIDQISYEQRLAETKSEPSHVLARTLQMEAGQHVERRLS